MAALGAALAALILVIDAILGRGVEAAELGALDEPAHLATCALALLAAVLLELRPTSAFLATALIASIAIDLDHVPSYLGWSVLTDGTPRPYTHGLVTLGLLCLASRSRGPTTRAALLGASFGVSAHLLRDAATGPGIAPLWPLTKTTILIPHGLYAALVAIIVAALVASAWSLRAGAGARHA